MIIASFTSMLHISVKDCDYRSQPDVWGNNDRISVKDYDNRSFCYPGQGNSKESFSSNQETGKVFSPEMPFYSKF